MEFKKKQSILSKELQEHYRKHGVSDLEAYIKNKPQQMMCEDASSPTTRFIRLNPRYDVNETLNLLRKELKDGEEVIEVPWLSRDLRFYAVPETFALSRSEAFNSGRIYGMDVSSGAAVAALFHEDHEIHNKLLGIDTCEEHKKGSLEDEDIEMRVLDLCCAPGLKTCAIADLLETRNSRNVHIIGVDISEKRLQLCKNIVKKYHVDHDTSGRKMPRTTRSLEDDIENTNESTNEIGCLTKQNTRIQLFHSDGTTFGIRDKRNTDSSLLIFDSRIALDQEVQDWRAGRKRKRMNKSARARESKSLKMVTNILWKSVNADIAGKPTLDSEQSNEMTIPLFDRVLVDAECSSDGAVRHLQQKFSRSKKMTTNSKLTDAQQLEDLVALQKKLIASGFRLLKRGGTMVYSTCSLAEEQNENVVSWLLNEFHELIDLVPVAFNTAGINEVSSCASSQGSSITDGKIKGTVRFHPSTSDDLFGGGFFLAKVRKR
jgi:16S rRNA C967 or C1407 C5-methylase (RsmB/RsmF family)